MSDDSEQVAEMIRSGAYFDESRSWYQALYIGPISERSFFLVIAGIATLIAIVSVFSVVSLMPITSRPGLLVPSSRPDEVVPHTVRIKPVGAPLNPMMRDFFLKQYVGMREGYEAATYVLGYNFIRAHSDESTFSNFAGIYVASNPQSPAAILGLHGRRLVDVTSVVVNEQVEPKVATVNFTTSLEGVASEARTRWTATIQFYYSDMTTSVARDPDTGNEVMTTQDPQFQVVNYALTQAQ